MANEGGRTQWRIQDLPEGEWPTPTGGGGTNLLFGQLSPRTAWKMKKLDRGGSKILVCRSATGTDLTFTLNAQLDGPNLPGSINKTISDITKFHHNSRIQKKKHKRSAGVAWGESEDSVPCRWRSRQARESTLALKTWADVTRSLKQRCQWPHKEFNKIKRKQGKIREIIRKRNNLPPLFILHPTGHTDNPFVGDNPSKSGNPAC